ncbi:hypothetical protein CCMA1212_009812 [Trichoderma ghanense]|uniref:Uncharacterized protein n=1 Tax=Trichoderma ghanense TaxID=65468 RepID=A0ABY2GTX3_9HYPO
MPVQVFKESAVERTIQQRRLLPPKHGDGSAESATKKMPPLVFYPDTTNTDVPESLYCLRVASFKRLPIKPTVKKKVVLAALLLKPVGHKADAEGYGPDLSRNRDLSELLFRRVGLVYTADGRWTDEHDEMLEKLPTNVVYVVQ